MKCTNCGHELEPGSGFCENCGTIMSLDNDFEETAIESNDIFSGSESVENEPEFNAVVDTLLAKELEIDETEQVVESEIVSDDEALAGVSYSDDELERQEIEEEDETQTEVQASEENDTQVQEPTNEEETQQIEEDNPFDAAEADYEEESAEETAEVEPDEPYEADNDGEDMYVKGGKSKKGGAAIAVMMVFLVAVVAVGANVIKRNFPVKPSEKVNASVSTTDGNTSESTKAEVPTTGKPSDDETESKTTEVTTLAEITDDETSNTTNKLPVITESNPNTTAKATERVTQGTTNKVTTTRQTVTTTRRYTTTRQYTTVPSTARPTAPKTTARPTSRPTTARHTTNRPSTTVKPNTTNSSATKPVTTTDPYGFNFVPVQKPSKYNSTTYKVYINTNALSLRSKPNTKAERIVYLPLGSGCTVYAYQDGFYYVRSDRYGVYGWIDENYSSKNRPESSTITIVPNLVKPDKTYKTQQTKYVNAAEGLRLRKGPSDKSDIILRLDNDFPVKVVGYSETVSGWIYVLDTTHGVYGWVASEFVK